MIVRMDVIKSVFYYSLLWMFRTYSKYVHILCENKI
jgi:hypothetical protein